MIKCLQFAFAFPRIQEILSSGQNYAATSCCALASCLQFESCCAGLVREESTGCLQRLEPWLLFLPFWNGPAMAYFGPVPVCIKSGNRSATQSLILSAVDRRQYP